MSYRPVPGDGLRTRWDDEPDVRVSNHRDAFGTVEVSWATQPVRTGWVARRTRVTFIDVAEYRWRYFDLDGADGEEGGLELGELVGSSRLAALRDQGFGAELRHFRISFDEHGIYDVVCRDLVIEYREESRTDAAAPTWTREPPH